MRLVMPSRLEAMEPWCTAVLSTRLIRLGDRPGLAGSRVPVRAVSTLRSSNVTRDVAGTGARRSGVRADTSRGLPSTCAERETRVAVRHTLGSRTWPRGGRCSHAARERRARSRTSASMASFLAAALLGDTGGAAKGSDSASFWAAASFCDRHRPGQAKTLTRGNRRAEDRILQSLQCRHPPVCALAPSRGAP
jgi:hypothetical protein